MTDLEKARSELLEIVSQVSQGSWTIVLLAAVQRVLEAARREGAEETRERVTSDATRENLVRVIRRYFGAYDQANGVPEEVANRVLECFAALPLTPEEPT